MARDNTEIIKDISDVVDKLNFLLEEVSDSGLVFYGEWQSYADYGRALPHIKLRFSVKRVEELFSTVSAYNRTVWSGSK